MKRIFNLLVLFCVLFAFVSCNRTDIVISSTQVQPFVTKNGQMGLSVYLVANVEDENGVIIKLEDPSGNLTWQTTAQFVEFDGLRYFGSSDFMMGEGSLLPSGTWKVSLIYKDGRVTDTEIGVFYSDVQGALERNSDSQKAVYDEASNLTVTPD